MLAAAFAITTPVQSSAADYRGTQFLSLDASRFSQVPGNDGESISLSPVIQTSIPWKELILSWNVQSTNPISFTFEVAAVHEGGAESKFYSLGNWSRIATNHSRESLTDQKDDFAEVQTDTLVLAKTAKAFRVRITRRLAGGRVSVPIDFLGACVSDTNTLPSPALLDASLKNSGPLDVPIRSQLDYPGGELSWCSPTSTSMILAYWAAKLKRPGANSPAPDGGVMGIGVIVARVAA